jgi:hypothetical protein
MTTARLIQRKLDEVETLIDTAIDQMTDISVWVKNQTRTPSATLPELLLLLKEADKHHLQTKRTLDLLDLARKQLLSLGNDAVKLSRVLGRNNYIVKSIALEIEKQMDRMKRLSGALSDLLNTDVLGVWQYLRTQFTALQATTPPLSTETTIHEDTDDRICGSR